MTKNKKYKLLGTKLNVQYVKATLNEDGDWIFGKVINKADNITIQISTTDPDGNPISEEAMELTLRHELFHFILDQLYFTEISENETVVEWLATATNELHKQGLSI